MPLLETRAVGPERFFFEFLEESGGSPDMTVNGSPTKYYLAAPAEQLYHVASVQIQIADATWVEDGFGGLAALSTGVGIEVEDLDGTQLIDFTAGNNIKTFADFGYLAGAQVATAISTGGTNKFGLVEWNLESGGAFLSLTAGQRLVFTINDDLTGLVTFQALVQGVVSY
jgi:hypothetical protein